EISFGSSNRREKKSSKQKQKGKKLSCNDVQCTNPLLVQAINDIFWFFVANAANDIHGGFDLHLLLCFHRIISGMWGNDCFFQLNEVIILRRFLLQNIDSSTGKMFRLEQFCERIFIDHSTPARIDDNGSFRKFPQLFLI